jgi:1-deoxy-D-xylulose-5-phosphate reductoisomerase
MSKNVAILGSTGSIGTNTLRVIEGLGPDYRVTALTAHTSMETLAEQTRKFKPDFVGITSEDHVDRFRELAGDYAGTVLCGPDSMSKIVQLEQVNTIVAAVVGAAGLPAVLKAAEYPKIIAIANKEPLVIAGKLLIDTAKKYGATILPIDSEHSAVFQALQAGKPDEVNKVILTASGGPFRNADPEQLEKATLDDALAHPTWDMGPKITIDSATMMNKALEIIEAAILFNIPPEKIEVLVHPESIVHSMVEFVDGSVIAQMGTPDMCVPIQYALTYPERKKGIATHLKLDELGKLTFEKPNLKTFPAIKLGFEVAEMGGTAPAVFNAANERAVSEFLDGKIKFTMIVELIQECLSKHTVKPSVCLDELLKADEWAREFVHDQIVQFDSC